MFPNIALDCVRNYIVHTNPRATPILRALCSVVFMIPTFTASHEQPRKPHCFLIPLHTDQNTNKNKWNYNVIQKLLQKHLTIILTNN